MSEIVEVFAKRGWGKTLLMSCEAGRCLRDQQLYRDCVAAIQAINAEGHNFSFPNRPPVYSDYRITISNGYKKWLNSYYMNGFRFGFENDKVKTLPVPPTSHVFLTEVQRYYNSKEKLKLPSWVSRQFEESRHFDLTMWLDLQRPVLVEPNIRCLVDRFLEVRGYERIRDKHGFVVQTNFLVREFELWSDVEKYLNGTGGNYLEHVISYPFDGYGLYLTRSYFRNFLPRNGKDFSYLEHIDANSADIDLDKYNDMYPQSAPEGYYVK